MANKKLNTTNATANTSIIDVTVNGLTVLDIVADIQKRLESVEKSVFNIALECAYALGKTIPEYTDSQGNKHGAATCDAPFKSQTALVEAVGRSNKTISRWCIAMDFVLEKGYFNIFASGLLPFSYDKIIMICKNADALEGYSLESLMNLSVVQLKDVIDKKTKSATVADTSEEENTTEENVENAEVVESPAELVTLTYNGKEYTVNKADFETWLANNAITEK